MKNAPLLWALFALLTGAYLLTYSGVIESGDSRSLFNMTASLYRFGDTLMDLNADQQIPPLPLADPNAEYPLRPFDIEPMQSLAALSLYALADRIPGLGLIHTTWMFNIVITAATACVVYTFGRALGFGARSSLAVALSFGLCTAALAYSKTFFREPLSALTVLAAALLAHHVRISGYRFGWIVGLATVILIMLLTRAASAFALPAFLILLLPTMHLDAIRRITPRLIVALVVLLVTVALVFSIGGQNGGVRYDILARLSGTPTYLATALQAYFLSIGGSIWGTSPVLLLAIPGCVLLWRRGHWRYALALPLLLLTYGVGYAWLSDVHWFGGLSWPPRFLIATIPLLMIGTLPIADAAISRATRRRWRWIAASLYGLLCAYGLLIQLTAVSLRWGDYLLGLPDAALSTLEWNPGLNQIAYLRWVVIPQLWGRVPLDLAWVRMDLPWWALAGALLIIACTLWLAWGVWRSRSPGRISGALAMIVLVFAIVGLRLFHDRDPLYRAGDPALQELVASIAAETTREDVVLLSNPAYVSYFMNYAKLHNAARIISLPDHPGDRPSPEQPPRVENDNPELLVLKESLPVIHALADTRERLWLVENFGPAIAWSTRPVEHYLATYFYPLRTLEFSPQVRLIEFDTMRAPDPAVPYAPQYTSNMVFGESIRLLGYDLPAGDTYQVGDSVPISLYWSTTVPLDRDYVVGVYLRTADGSPIAQSDSTPTWSFAPTSRWQVGIPVWDNRALRLPDDIPPGYIQIWIKVYGFDENFSASDLPATGRNVLEGAIGVLEDRLRVTSDE